MDASYLLKRRAAVVARHELLESVPGSGYHPDDDQARAEQRKGHKPLSARPVAIQHDGRSWFCGPDVGVIREALRQWVEKFRAGQKEHKEAAAAAGIEPSPPSPQARQAEAVSARVAGETEEVLSLPNNELNAILFGLNELAMQVVAVGVLP